MNSGDRAIIEVFLGAGIGLLTHSFGWGFIAFALAVLIIESVAAYWNQR